MKVILKRDTAKLGKRGEVVEVSDAYAINVLIRKGDAVQATNAELAQWKQKEDAKKYKKEIATNMFLQVVSRLHKDPINIVGKKRDDRGQLFAQVKEQDIVDAIFSATQVSLDPKQVHISGQIKSLGEHTVTLKQGEEISTIRVIVK